jgi:hypothetical protein
VIDLIVSEYIWIPFWPYPCVEVRPETIVAPPLPDWTKMAVP